MNLPQKIRPNRKDLKRKSRINSPVELRISMLNLSLRGRTLRAYLFILKSPKPVGVRELQRSLGLSSPSVAYHHLDKLIRLGLIEKDQYLGIHPGKECKRKRPSSFYPSGKTSCAALHLLCGVLYYAAFRIRRYLPAQLKFLCNSIRGVCQLFCMVRSVQNMEKETLLSRKSAVLRTRTINPSVRLPVARTLERGKY